MAIQKISPEVHSRSLHTVRMWRENLKEIESLIAELGDGEIEIEITASKSTYLVDGIDDIGDMAMERIDKLRIETSDERFVLELGDANFLLAVEPSLQVRMIMDQIAKVAKKNARFRLIQWFFEGVSNIALWLIIFGSFIYFGVVRNWGSILESSAPDWVVLLAGVVLLTVWHFWARPTRSLMYTMTRAEKPPFWQRNRDELAIALGSLIAGGILGYWINTIT